MPTLHTKANGQRVTRWRREIVDARIKLAEPGLSPQRCSELWQVVDCREWFIQMVTDDFPAELEQIDRDIEHRLRRRKFG